jgi:hypothetical protein
MKMFIFAFAAIDFSFESIWRNLFLYTLSLHFCVLVRASRVFVWRLCNSKEERINEGCENSDLNFSSESQGGLNGKNIFCIFSVKFY